MTLSLTREEAERLKPYVDTVWETYSFMLQTRSDTRASSRKHRAAEKAWQEALDARRAMIVEVMGPEVSTYIAMRYYYGAMGKLSPRLKRKA